MAISHATAQQHSLLLKTLMEQLDPKDPLMLLSKRIPWESLCSEFADKYSELCRPAKDVRLMIGLLLLKQMENLSDERLVVEWTHTPAVRFIAEHEPDTLGGVTDDVYGGRVDVTAGADFTSPSGQQCRRGIISKPPHESEVIVICRDETATGR